MGCGTKLLALQLCGEVTKLEYDNEFALTLTVSQTSLEIGDNWPPLAYECSPSATHCGFD